MMLTRLRRLPRLAIMLAACAAVGGGVFCALALAGGSDSPAPYPAEQVAAISDGRVTYEEHEAATQRTIACVLAAGVDAHAIPGSGMRPTRFVVNVPATGPGDVQAVRQANATVSACRAEHLDVVDAAWSGQRPEPDAAAIRGLRERLVACVASLGESEGAAPATGADGAFMISVRYRADDGSGPRVPDGADRDVVLGCRLAVEAATGLLIPADS